MLALVTQSDVCPTGDLEIVCSILPCPVTFFHVDWSWNIFFSHCLSSTDSRREVVSFLWKKVHKYWLTTYCPFNHLERRFSWHFILNENILFWLTIIYQKPFIFSVSEFCSQIFILKLNLCLNISLTYAISIVQWILAFFLRKYILLFFPDFKLLMFHNNVVKISEKMNRQNLLKTYILLWEEVKISDFFFFNQWLE